MGCMVWSPAEALLSPPTELYDLLVASAPPRVLAAVTQRLTCVICSSLAIHECWLAPLSGHGLIKHAPWHIYFHLFYLCVCVSQLELTAGCEPPALGAENQTLGPLKLQCNGLNGISYMVFSIWILGPQLLAPVVGCLGGMASLGKACHQRQAFRKRLVPLWGLCLLLANQGMSSEFVF